jgi:hypothetical protein
MKKGTFTLQVHDVYEPDGNKFIVDQLGQKRKCVKDTEAVLELVRKTVWLCSNVTSAGKFHNVLAVKEALREIRIGSTVELILAVYQGGGPEPLYNNRAWFNVTRIA